MNVFWVCLQNNEFCDKSLPNISFKHLIDSLDIHKKLCKGEVVNYKGILGKYSDMQLKDLPDIKQPPVILGAIGPKALKVAGTYFDGAILHPFLTTEGVHRCSKIVKDAAAKAGKDPNKIKIYGYKAGTWGPKKCNDLFRNDNTWRYPCKNLVNDGEICEL